MGESRDKLKQLEAKLAEFSKLVSIPAKLEEISRYESRMGDGAFWNDQARAQEVVVALKAVKAVVDPYLALMQAVRDTGELLEMAEGERPRSRAAMEKPPSSTARTKAVMSEGMPTRYL